MRTSYKITVAVLVGLAVYQIYDNVKTTQDSWRTLSSLIGKYTTLALTSQIRHVPKREEVRTTRTIQGDSGTQPDGSLPDCPETPPGLVGNITEIQEPQMVKVVMKKLSYLKLGGHYAPPDCRPAQRMAIIIPYRDRWIHLHILLNNLVPFLRRQQASFDIFVIEQALPGTFNRAMLLNIGFVEALKRDYFTCFMFHDVDLIPLNDHHYYRCGPQPINMAVSISKFKFKMPSPYYFGGVVAMSREQVEAVNGNSNLFFGWGGEDDDLKGRVEAKNMTVARGPMNVARYWMVRHPPDKGNDMNKRRTKMLLQTVARMPVDGLNSLVYAVNSVELKPLYTWINVSINRTEVTKYCVQNPDMC